MREIKRFLDWLPEPCPNTQKNKCILWNWCIYEMNSENGDGICVLLREMFKETKEDEESYTLIDKIERTKELVRQGYSDEEIEEKLLKEFNAGFSPLFLKSIRKEEEENGN